MSFFTKAVTRALELYPDVNSMMDGDYKISYDVSRFLDASIDKVVHMIIFYFVGLWFFLITKQDHSFILMILLCIYALTMELLQMSLAYRSFDWFDWVADVFGLLLSFFHLSKKL